MMLRRCSRPGAHDGARAGAGRCGYGRRARARRSRHRHWRRCSSAPCRHASSPQQQASLCQSQAWLQDTCPHESKHTKAKTSHATSFATVQGQLRVCSWTCAGDMMAPAPGPAAAPQINIVYIQQAGNARMTPSPTDPTSGVLTMNNALDTTLYDQVLPRIHLRPSLNEQCPDNHAVPSGAVPRPCLL